MEKFIELNLTKLFPMLNVSPSLEMRNCFIYGICRSEMWPELTSWMKKIQWKICRKK